MSSKTGFAMRRASAAKSLVSCEAGRCGGMISKVRKYKDGCNGRTASRLTGAASRQ
jgi:hypothetical protein